MSPVSIAIETGDIQWMTTGSGLIHSELVTDKFKKSGGVMQGLQIWVNLPQKNKNVKPWYQHIKKNDIPSIDEGNDVLIKVLVGKVKNTSSAEEVFFTFPTSTLINTSLPSSIEGMSFFLIC